MLVKVGSQAWLPRDELTPDQVVNLKKTLTIVPRKVGDMGEDPEPFPIYTELNGYLGVPREFFFLHRRPIHQVQWQVTEGATDWKPAPFVGTLRPEQRLAVETVVTQFRAGRLGGILQAKGGSGKTVMALAIAAELRVPTLVVVHKEFLVEQWKERVRQFMPEAEIGHIQQDVCDYRGKTITVGMVHSLAGGQYPADMYGSFGLLIGDEIHRIAAKTWSAVPPKFSARFRLGVSATVRRKDGANNVFYWHIGPIIFAGKEERLVPKIKRVWTKFRLVNTDRFNPNLAPRHLLLRFLCGSVHRNQLIASKIVEACLAGRKCIVLSERLEHLDRLEDALRVQWLSANGPLTVGYYVGGQTKAHLEEAAKAQVILATVQFACVDVDAPLVDPIQGNVYTLRSLQDRGEGRLPAVIGGTGSFSIQYPRSSGIFGEKACLEIETVGGAKVVVSEDHLMWTDRGWVAARDLQVGGRGRSSGLVDYLASPRSVYVEPTPVDLTEDQAWVLGVMIGNGCLSQIRKGFVELTSSDSETVAEVDRILRTVGMYLKRSRYQHWRVVSFDGKAGRGRKTWMRQQAERYRLDRTARNKCLPECLMTAPLPVIRGLLAGMYDTDGGLASQGQVAFSSSSPVLLEQIRTLLLRFGIPVIHPIVPGKDGCAHLRIVVADVARFMDQIQPRLPRKCRESEGLLRYRRVGPTNAVPWRYVQELREALQVQGVPLKQARKWCRDAGLTCDGFRFLYQPIPLEAYQLVAGRIGFLGSLDALVVWRRVVGVRSAGRRLVGDLAVPPTKSWLFQGVVVHNSEGLDIPALDTLFLATPISDVEQAMYRICRVHEGKKEPIVVDFRDDSIPMFQAQGRLRDKFYATLGN